MNIGIMKKHFANLYDAQSDSVFRYTLMRVSDRESALDITQEAFMKYWDALSKGTGIREPRAFLFTTVRHLIIDWYRKKKPVSLEDITEGSTDGDDDSIMPLVDPASENFMDLELSAEARFLIEKIRDLEPTYQQAVYLRFVEGLSPKEIAEILHISVSAASVRVHRGIEKLRQNTGYENI
jgi:RNA polymerase sigma-70 factor (ECF subfamily)